MGLRIRDLAGEKVQVSADPTLGAVVEATDKTRIDPLLSKVVMGVLKRMFSLPRGLISLTLTLGPGASIRVQTKGYKDTEPEPMTAVQAMEVAERIELAQISDKMRKERFSIDMDKAQAAFDGLDKSLEEWRERNEQHMAGVRKVLEGEWGSMGEPVGEAESQAAQRHMMASTGWPPFARPGTAEDHACGDCRQADTCKRINTCVAHNCAFGEASPP